MKTSKRSGESSGALHIFRTFGNVEFDYETVKNVAGRVGSGELEIAQLTAREEQSPNPGGRRNVEASITAGTEARTSQTTSRGSGENRKEKPAPEKQVEAKLEQFAKNEME